MNTPLLTWVLILGIVIMVFAIDAICSYSRNHKRNTHHQPLIGIESERELFYLPGDPNPHNQDLYDYEDTEDY
ncbi:MAG: hypothetical protein NC339_08850 [Muribaculaceae bacterium]|nr:hypothetical protein [Muribaculaceae bacterium]